MIDPNEIDDQNKPPKNFIEARKEFLDALIESIKKEGVRNPITIRARYIDQPPEAIFGYNRLWSAKKAGAKEIPCIVNDYCDKYPDAEILESPKDIREHFKEQPYKVRIKNGVAMMSEPIMDQVEWTALQKYQSNEPGKEAFE